MSKYYCSTHGPRLVCNCDSPRMVHMCEFEQCGVEIYDHDQPFCERHEADGGFLARGGPVNIFDHFTNVEPVVSQRRKDATPFSFADGLVIGAGIIALILGFI